MTDTEKHEEPVAEETPVVEESPADETASEAQTGEEAPEPKPKKRRKSSWLSWFLLIVLVGTAVAGWILMPAKNRQQITTFVVTHLDRLEKSHKQQPPAEPAATPETASRPATAETTAGSSEPATAPKSGSTSAAGSVPAPAPESAATLPKSIPAELPAASAPAEKPVTAEAEQQTATPAEIKTLTASIDKLTAELRDMRQEQQKLQQSMRAQQQLQLRAHLNRIADDDSRLPQMAGAWQDILLLPILSDAQRTQAESMQQLAARDAANLKAWRKQLEHLAASLPIPKRGDVIPKPKNTWLSWLAGQFHLRPAPTAQREALTALHNRLIDAAHALAAESWPDAKTWKALLADTRARLGKKEINLPESLADVRQDKLKMQALAQNWLEQF